MADEKVEKALEACEETVEELKVENEKLRESSESFGALAERLNQALRTESDPESVHTNCPRCGQARHVHPTSKTARGHDLHCDYCGNSWH